MNVKILQAIAIVSAIFILAANAPAAEYYKLSLAGIKLEKNDRITGFEITIKPGKIQSIPNVPGGWELLIDNDPSRTSSIKGTAAVGAAFLGSSDKNLLENLLTIERLTEGLIPKDIPFEVKATIHIVNTETEQERTVTENKGLLIRN
jgi:hypothetical protein